MPMTPLLTSFWSAANTESAVALRTIVYLRLLMLAMVTVFLLVWSLVTEPYQHWNQTVVIFLVTTLWSIIVLKKESLQQSDWSELRELLVDILWVFAIVFIAGRTTNPFIYYYLVLTAIAATLLSSGRAWSLCGLCIVLYSTMLAIDLKDHFTHFSNDYKIHLIGMWINYVGSSLIICFFVSKLIVLLRKQQSQMSAIRENNLKNEQLVGLATVSASTIHNLATPLSTLTLLIDDVAADKDLNTHMSRDLDIMREQIIRCQNTMQALSDLAKRSDEKLVHSVVELVRDLNDHFALHYPDTRPEIVIHFERECAIECSPLFEYAIINLVNNAIESATSRVHVDLSIADRHLHIAIRNQYDETIDSLSTRWGTLSSSNKETGLGIGSLLANSTIERQGGDVKLEILPAEDGSGNNQIVVTIRFPISL